MNDMKRASLGQIEDKKARGELFHDQSAPADVEALGPEFWLRARLQPARTPRSVHLKLEPDVFEYFKRQGKGHLTKMQDVLKAYVKAHN